LRQAVLVVAVVMLVVLGGIDSRGTSAMATDDLELDAIVSYTLPDGWDVEKSAGRADPGVRLSRSLHVIQVRLFGGRDSRYASAEAYLRGFEATTMGRPPEKVGIVTVAAVDTWLYRHGYPIDLGDPHISNPRFPSLATEKFCILRTGSRFLVLSHTYESPIPDPFPEGEEAWEGFLRSFRLLKASQ
jgi:hypothetical protein